MKSPEFYVFADIFWFLRNLMKANRARRASLPQGHNKSKPLSQEGQGHPKELQMPADGRPGQQTVSGSFSDFDVLCLIVAPMLLPGTET